ncbi:MAG: tetratricopeptide repeat protein [Tepidisphaeraceae bacterium]
MARRVNTKFLTILLLIFIGVVGATFLAFKLLVREHPDHYVALGQQALKDHKWSEAVEDFAKAARLDRKDPRLQMLLGQALGNTVQIDPQASRQQVAAFQQALEIDPKYLPALLALSDFFNRAAGQTPDASLYRSAIDYTNRARALDPSDENLASLPDRLVIQEWVANMEVDQKDVDNAEKELGQQWKLHPENAELPYAIALAKIQQGLYLAAESGPQLRSKEVAAFYDQAIATFASVLTGKDGGSQDHNALMHYRFAQVLARLSTVQQSSPDLMKTDLDRASAEISRARALVKPDDPRFLEVNEFAAALAQQRNDRAGALAIYRALPYSTQGRLDLADLLGRSPDTRVEAVKILKSTLASLQDDPTHVVLGGMRFRLLLTLANIQVGDYLTMPDSTAKTALHDEIKANLDKLDQAATYRTILSLKEIEARFRLHSTPEEEMAEVQTLSKLTADDPAAAKDPYVQALLAEGYEETNQRATAVTVLKGLVQGFQHQGPASNKEMEIQVRKNLVGLLLTEQPDQVPAQLDELERIDPGDPGLNLERVQWLLSDPEKNKDEIEKLYRPIGEGTPALTATKARVALQIKDYDDAIRLLKATLAKAPKDVTDTLLLARVLYAQGKQPEALRTATDGLAANPGDPRLRLLISALKGESPKVLQDLQEELAKENPDKVQGELTLAALASSHGDAETEEAHLKAAEKLQPDLPRIQDLLFNFYLGNHRYNDAAKCIPKLAKADADRAGGEFYRLSIAEAQQDHAGAEEIARRLIQDRPEYSRSWLALGDVLQQEGQYDQAIPQYLQCLQKQSNVPEAYTGLARCYYALHKPDDALHTIEQGMTRMPGDVALREMKLTHELNYGQPADAVAEIQAELRLRPNQPDLYAAMADVVLRYAAILQSNHQSADAINQAQQAINALKEPLVKWPNESELYVAMSEAQLAARQPEEALKTLERWAALDAWRTRPDPYVALADFYERTGNPQKAEDEMHTAMARSGYAVDMQIRMASMLALHQKYDDALQLLRAVNADKPAVREKVVQILLVAGKLDEAQVELKADLAKHPPDSELLLQVWALALFEHGLNKDAVDRATEALAENPKDQTALFCRARARLRMQPPDPAGALQDLDLVRQSNPNNIEVRMDMAQSLDQLNRPEDALSEVQAALRLNPLNRDVRLKLVGMYVNNPHPRMNEALRLLQEVEATPPFDKDSAVFQGEAMILSAVGHDADALAKSEIALRISPDDQNIARTNIQMLQKVQDFPGVINHYASMSDKWKKKSWALWDLGMAEKRLNNPQGLTDLKSALAAAVTEDDPRQIDQVAQSITDEFSADEAINALKPLAKDNLSAKLSLAHEYQAKGDDTSALATIDDIMVHFDKLSHRDQANTLNSAAIMYQLAKPVPLVDKAYDAYLHWLKLEPTNLEALNNLACLLADNYSPPRAKEGLDYANQAVNEMSRLGRTEPRLLDTQGWLMILNGSPEDGVHILNTAMTQFEPFPDEYLHLGEGYLRLEMPDPMQAETQAKLGLQTVNKRHAGNADAAIRSKLQDLINRSEEMRHKQ